MAMMNMTRPKASSLLYDAGNGGGDGAAASEFISRLMAGATMLHMHHLMVTGPGSFAKHMALDAYGDLADAADKLAEAYIGCTGTPLSFSGQTVTIGADCAADVKALYEYVETARGAMGTESHIQNEVDGVATLLAGVLYKLNRLA